MDCHVGPLFGRVCASDGSLVVGVAGSVSGFVQNRKWISSTMNVLLLRKDSCLVVVGQL